MTPRGRVAAMVGGCAALGVVLLLAAGGDEGTRGSALSAGRAGWLAGRLYLEERGVEVELRDRPLEAAAEAGRSLVLVAPFQRVFSDDELAQLDAFLRAGGLLVYGYSGDDDPGFGEKQLQTSLDLQRAEALRPEAPLGPEAWWAYQDERFVLAPAAAGQPEFSVAAFAKAPSAPTNAEILYRGPGERPLIYRSPRLRGRLLVLPAALLSNVEITANLAAAELLRAAAGDAWTFHEYGHGMVAVELARERARFSWNLFVIQLVLIYLAAVWTLGRPFGPRLREEVARHGSAGVFLRQVGQLHDRLGHHAEAARLLVERSRQLDEAFVAGLDLGDARVAGAGAFLELARKLARAPNIKKKEGGKKS